MQIYELTLQPWQMYELHMRLMQAFADGGCIPYYKHWGPAGWNHTIEVGADDCTLLDQDEIKATQRNPHLERLREANESGRMKQCDSCHPNHNVRRSPLSSYWLAFVEED